MINKLKPNYLQFIWYLYFIIMRIYKYCSTICLNVVCLQNTINITLTEVNLINKLKPNYLQFIWYFVFYYYEHLQVLQYHLFERCLFTKINALLNMFAHEISVLI